MELDRETYTRQDGNQPTEPAPTAQVQEPVQEPVQREEPTQIAQNQQQPAYDYDQQERSRTLPRTASPLPLIGLAGLASLGASLFSSPRQQPVLTLMELDRETYTRQDGNQPTEPAPTAQVQEPVQEPVQREEPTQIAQNQQQPAYDYDQQERSRTLPRTASPLPLIGLAGLASLGASLLVRRVSNRS